MKKITNVAFACVLAMGLAATNARGSSLSIGDSRYLGHIVDGIPPADQLTFLNDLLSMNPGSGPTVIGTETYYRSSNTCGGTCPANTTVASGIKTNTSSGNGIDVNGYRYLLGKYDGPDAGSHVWYVGGLSTVDIPTKVPKISDPDSMVGISNIFRAGTYTRPPDQVPDGGMTLILLGGALVGFETLRRKLRA